MKRDKCKGNIRKLWRELMGRDRGRELQVVKLRTETVTSLSHATTLSL